MMKAESDETLKHFKGSKHQPDIYDEGSFYTSPSTEFDLEDWDSHREIEDWGFDKSKRKLMPRFHEIGPDGEPVIPLTDIHAASTTPADP